MINLKRILRGLPKYDNPDPKTARTEQQQVLYEIGLAIDTGGFDFTSRRSIRIYRLIVNPDDTLEARSIDVEWKLYE